MTVTTTTLTRGAAVADGVILIGVQINHPHLDADSVTTTEVVLRNSLKVLMAALALAGITGMYLRQVRAAGLLGLVGRRVQARQPHRRHRPGADGLPGAGLRLRGRRPGLRMSNEPVPVG